MSDQSKERQLKVLLIDDHTVVRQGIAEVLSTVPDILVVGEANDGAEGVELAAKVRPDVVLLDVEMPVMGAAEALGRIAQVSANSKVVILSMHDDFRLVHRLLKLGAKAYVIKSAARDELVSAIRIAAYDKDTVMLSVSRDTLNRLEENPSENLSDRELEVLLLVARGRSNIQIAHQLRISEGTVKRHLANIYTKLGVNSRGEATRKAVSEGWFTPQEMEE